MNSGQAQPPDFRANSFPKPDGGRCGRNQARMEDDMKRTLLTLALATGLATAGAASAQRYYAPEYDYARVVDVDPIVDYERRPVSREVCYDEPVRYRDAGYRRGDSTTPMIAGAVIGGVVGNQFG